MAKLFWEPDSMLAPVPAALVSSGTVEKPNVMTAAWVGIVSSRPAMTYVSLQPPRYTHDIVSETGEFVINLPPASLAKETDFCGVKSGRDVDKFKECGFTALAASQVAAPLIAQCPAAIECKVDRVLHLGSHDMFLANIVAVVVDEEIVVQGKKLDFEKAGLLAYAHGEYIALGKGLGRHGFSVKEK